MLLRSGLNHHCRHSEYANKDNKFDTSGYVGPRKSKSHSPCTRPKLP